MQDVEPVLVKSMFVYVDPAAPWELVVVTFRTEVLHASAVAPAGAEADDEDPPAADVVAGEDEAIPDDEGPPAADDAAADDAASPDDEAGADGEDEPLEAQPAAVATTAPAATAPPSLRNNEGEPKPSITNHPFRASARATGTRGPRVLLPRQSRLRFL